MRVAALPQRALLASAAGVPGPSMRTVDVSRRPMVMPLRMPTMRVTPKLRYKFPESWIWRDFIAKYAFRDASYFYTAWPFLRLILCVDNVVQRWRCYQTVTRYIRLLNIKAIELDGEIIMQLVHNKVRLISLSSGNNLLLKPTIKIARILYHIKHFKYDFWAHRS